MKNSRRNRRFDSPVPKSTAFPVDTDEESEKFFAGEREIAESDEVQSCVVSDERRMVIKKGRSCGITTVNVMEGGAWC